MSRILVIAPHPDDETLGCGGLLLKQREQRDEIGWIIVTSMKAGSGYSQDRITLRQSEIDRTARSYGVSYTESFDFAPASLTESQLPQLITRFSAAYEKFEPDTLLVPFRGDAHSDHRITFDASTASAKWFRAPSIKRILAYETPSETGFNLDPHNSVFWPNVFVDIGAHLDRKIEILGHYPSELGSFPFPRSPEAVRALAAWRGAQCGTIAAEAYLLLKDIR